jgi:predicted ester cyclase
MEHSKEIIRNLYSEAINWQNSPDIKTRGVNFTQYTVSAKPNSLKAFKEFFEAVSQAFPDYKLTIDNMLVKGDRVMARYTISGTQKGSFLGMAPTNEKLTITGIDIFRLEKGRVIQHWDAAHQISASPEIGRQAVTTAMRPNSAWRQRRGVPVASR